MTHSRIRTWTNRPWQWLAAALVLAMLTGCTVTLGTRPTADAEPQATPQASAPQDPQQTAIASILKLKQDGQLTDAQASQMLMMLINRQPAAAATAAPAAAAPEAATTAVATPAKPAAAESAMDKLIEAFPHYASTEVLHGRMRSIGSDTMDNIMKYWETSFRVFHPDLHIYHVGKGSSTAPPALTGGLSDVGPMSRAIKAEEIAAFKQQYGYEPTQVRVALDTIGVYVNPANPIAKLGLNFQQLDAIFSSTRKRGATKDYTTWGDLGLTGEWADAPIHVFSRNSASGTYGFFKDHVLAGGDYKATNANLVGSAAVVSAVAADTYAIGYSGIGYKTPGVATPPLTIEPGGTMYAAEERYAYSGQYPLARYLYLTFNAKPGAKLPPLTREFIHFVYSQEGQRQVMQDGFYPVSLEIAHEELKKLGEE